MIRTYIGWARDHAEDLRRSQHRLSTARALRTVEGGITGPEHPAVTAKERDRPGSTGRGAVEPQQSERRVTTGRGHPAVNPRSATGPGYPPVSSRTATGPGYPPVGKGSDAPVADRQARPGTDPANPRVRPAASPAAVDDDLDVVELRRLYQDALKTVKNKDKP